MQRAVRGDLLAGKGLRLHYAVNMRVSRSSQLIALLLAPLLLASGAVQGLSLMWCGSEVRMACCCSKSAAPAAAATITAGTQRCCDPVAVPAAPAQERSDQGRALVSPAPLLLAVAGPATPVRRAERMRPAPAVEPPPRTSPVLANCAFLI